MAGPNVVVSHDMSNPLHQTTTSCLISDFNYLGIEIILTYGDHCVSAGVYMDWSIELWISVSNSWSCTFFSFSLLSCLLFVISICHGIQKNMVSVKTLIIWGWEGQNQGQCQGESEIFYLYYCDELWLCFVCWVWENWATWWHKT